MRPASLVRLALGLVLAVFAAGCSSNNKGKIEGTKWTNQAATIKGKDQPAGSLVFEFHEDKTLIYSFASPAGKQDLKGKYSLSREDYVVLTFDQQLAGRKVHTEKVSIRGDQMTMTDSDGTSVPFVRVQRK